VTRDALRGALLVGFAAASIVMQAACSSGSPPTSDLLPSPAQLSPSPSPLPQVESPAPRARPPASRAVVFSGLRPGTYPVHLHSRCNGSQGFHIIVLGSLRVEARGSGSINVSSSYFSRGLCVIVYSNTSVSAVLTTRPI
jgi:hypothetical protein